MHKEAQQATGGPKSLGATSEDGAHPQLSSGHDASADSTTEANPGLSAPIDSIPLQQGRNEESRADKISKKIKLEDLSDLLKDTRSAFFTPDSPQDDQSLFQIREQQKAKAEAKVASLKARPSYPDINQLTNLLVTSLKPEFSKLLASHDFSSCLPNALKELSSKFTELSREIKELKKHVQDMEIELPVDLKEIPTKLETFTSTISSLSSQVAELKNIQWELSAEFQDLPCLQDVVQACPDRKEKGWKTIYGLIKTRMEYLDQTEKELNIDFNKPLKEQDPLNELNELANKKRKRTSDFVVENASGATTKDVPSAGQATASPAEGEKNTKDAKTNWQNELVDLLGIDVVEQYHKKKLLFDKYCDKMLKRRKSSKIINCDVINNTKRPYLTESI
ncbi:hypothetical protein Tco_1310328 [Tanacetum coccineum]